jgi:hypothetical protein
MDWWDASPFTVAQLPFHRMSTYPYPAGEHFPDDPDAVSYQLNFNDRFDSGEPVRSYRFNYQYLPSTPADDRSIAPAGAAVNAPAGQNTSGAPSFTRSVREGWDATTLSSPSTDRPTALGAQP